MNTIELLNSGLDISITIKASELKKYSESLIKSAIARQRAEIESNPDEVYYTIDRVAEIFKVDRTTLFRWSKRDYLKSIKVGGMVRYRKSDIDNILNVGS